MRNFTLTGILNANFRMHINYAVMVAAANGYLTTCELSIWMCIKWIRTYLLNEITNESYFYFFLSFFFSVKFGCCTMNDCVLCCSRLNVTKSPCKIRVNSPVMWIYMQNDVRDRKVFFFLPGASIKVSRRWQEINWVLFISASNPKQYKISTHQIT